jgi:hypothetical protein
MLSYLISIEKTASKKRPTTHTKRQHTEKTAFKERQTGFGGG